MSKKIIILVILLALILSGCGSNNQEDNNLLTEEDSNNLNTSNESNSANESDSADTPDDSSSSPDVTFELPVEVSGSDPENFPLPEGAVRWFFMDLGADDVVDYQVMYYVPAESASEVYEFYQEELGDYGWEISLSAAIAEGGMITASDDGVYVAVMIGSDESFEGYVALSVTISNSTD